MLAGGLGLLVMLIMPPLLLRVYIAWRYQRRVQRMIEQLPQLLDHSVRSLKSGRTLADAVLGAIDSTEAPLKQAMSRIQRNVQMGVSLPESVSDFAEFYERDEFRLFALGLKVNHRYGGNASELLENLIKMIREREQGARQLKAMTGETRMTAYVLGGLAHRHGRLLFDGQPGLPDEHVERRNRALPAAGRGGARHHGHLRHVAHVAEYLRWPS